MKVQGKESKTVKIIRMKEKHQVTIPKHICEELNLDVGDYFKIGMKNRRIVMIPQLVIDKNRKKRLIRKVIFPSE